jgi:hypothetical protein
LLSTSYGNHSRMCEKIGLAGEGLLYFVESGVVQVQV